MAKYKLARVDDIITAFQSIQRKQDKANRDLFRLSTTVSAINTKVANQVGVLRSQVYLFSKDMGWLGIWDMSAGSYIGFINISPSDSGKITVAVDTGSVFLLGDNGKKLFIIEPYLPGVKRSLSFESVASFAVSPDGQRVYVSHNNSPILTEVEASSGKTARNFTLPGTALHLTYVPGSVTIYFSVSGTRAVYSLQRLSGETAKVFDLPDDAVKITTFRVGKEPGLLVLSGRGENAAITRWDKATETSLTVRVADASEIVANPFAGRYYLASMQNVLFMSLDGTVLKTVNLGEAASQLTLTADGTHLIAVVGDGHDALLIDTISGVVSPGPKANYPPTQQAASLLLAQAQFGFTSN